MAEFDIKSLELTLEKINQKQSQIELEIGKKLDSKAIETLQTELKEQKTLVESLSKIGEKGAEKNIVEYVKTLQSQVDTYEKELKEMKEINSRGPVSVKSELERLVKSEEFKNFKAGMNTTFEIKAATAINTSNSFTQTNGPIIMPQRDPIIGVSPLKDLVLSRICTGRTVGMTDTIDWIERTTDTNAATRVLENGVRTTNTSDLGWTTYKNPVEEKTDYALVSKNKLADTDFIQSEIMTVLNENIPYLIEYDIVNGNGTSPQFKGLLGASIAKAFEAPTGTAGAVKKANRYSALKAAILQVNLGDTSKPKNRGFIPNYALVNPVDYFLLSEEKDDQGQYLMGSDGVMRVLGVPILQTQFLNADTYLVGDFTKAELYTRQGLTIEMFNQHSDIAAYGYVAFFANQRGCLKVKNVNAFAFVTGTFDNTIRAITQSLG